MTKTAEMLLIEDEVRAILDACQRSINRAFISCYTKGGFCVGELDNLTWRYNAP